MEKKIIDLGIIPELEVSGVKKISLVEEPAIELDFLYFKKENFVTPSAGAVSYTHLRAHETLS
jgi:hypothetical protein